MAQARRSFGQMLGSALRLRCAWCNGKPGFLKGRFRRHECCQSCGLSVQRGEDGFELGAAALNAIFSLGLMIVVGAIGVILTLPDIAVAPIIGSAFVCALIFPVLFYPYTYTIWFAMTLKMDPPSDEQLAEAATRKSKLSTSNA